jgi:probable F420-dependent oxidoreductase
MEPFVLFGYMAGFTERIEFGTNIIILPQRQTTLVAKQAATLDVLTGGRLRFGVGLGWNEIEYISLGANFRNRGRRIEEQVALLRKLWTEPLVNFSGKWHTIPDAGINPLPVQRPIPIWFGGHAEPALRRTAQIGDGWMTNYRSPEAASEALELIDRVLAENNRDRTEFGIEARLAYGDGDTSAWDKLIRDWEAQGATHLSFNTMGAGFQSPEEHLEAIKQFASHVGLNPA